MAVYTGLASVTNGSATVTVTSGFTISPLAIFPGAIVFLNGVGYIVNTITNTTQFTLTRTYQGTTATGVRLDIDTISQNETSIVTLNTRTADLLEELLTFDPNGNLASLGSLDGTGGDKLLVLNGVGSAATTPLSDLATKATTQTLRNKTLAGQQQIFTEGSRMGITSGDAPLSILSAILHLVNEGDSTCGFRVQAYWAGSAAQPYQNNDCSLYEVFNTVESASTNLSWAVSACNGFNDIPAGTKDSGYRVGVKGWATSVCGPTANGYEHRGVLQKQIGIWGTAGFQGSGSLGTPEINEAWGVHGYIHNDIAGATIYDARAGFFHSIASVGEVIDNYAVFAEARNGVTNYSFFGEAGLLRQKDAAQFDGQLNVLGSLLNGGIRVVESGTNANGYWVRYSDGTQTCTKTVTLGSVTFPDASGALFVSGIKSGGGYANTFSAKPVTSVNVVSSTGLVWPTVGVAGTASAYPQFYLLSPVNSTSSTTSLELTATGRWY